MSFSDLIYSGFKVLTHWEIYIAAIGYSIISWASAIAHHYVIIRTESWLTSFLTNPLMYIIRQIAFIMMMLIIAPIILGFSEDAAWSLPWQFMINNPDKFFKMIGIFSIVVVIFSTIPILGQIKTLQTFLLGSLSLAVVLINSSSDNSVAVAGSLVFFPGWWFTIGIILVSVITFCVGFIVTCTIVAYLKIIDDEFIPIMMSPIYMVLSLIPVFIYSKWMVLQLAS